jgi:hypothetical protein
MQPKNPVCELPQNRPLATSAHSHASQFTMAKDGRKQPIRGLWERNGKYIARISVEDDAGVSRTRWVPLEDADHERRCRLQHGTVTRHKRLAEQRNTPDELRLADLQPGPTSRFHLAPPFPCRRRDSCPAGRAHAAFSSSFGCRHAIADSRPGAKNSVQLRLQRLDPRFDLERLAQAYRRQFSCIHN